MNKIPLRLLAELEKIIGRIDESKTDNAMTENRYETVAHYWRWVKDHIHQSNFLSDAAEIDFFRNIKPKFTAFLEYFLLLYRYQVSAGGGEDTLDQFRREELDRIRKFREKHATFINYYEQGGTGWDDVYFLRRKFNKVQRPPSQVYDRVREFWTNGDWIITRLQADRLFEQLLQPLKTSA
jgi:RteC protein